MTLEDFLREFKHYLQEILISGVKYLSASNTKKLKKYEEKSDAFNLLSLKERIQEFLNSTKRVSELIDLLMWVDVASIQYESMKVESEA